MSNRSVICITAGIYLNLSKFRDWVCEVLHCWEKNPDTSTHFFNTSLGTQLQSFTILSMKIFLLISNPSLSGASSGHFLSSFLLSGRRDEPPHHNLLSGSCKELQGAPKTSFSPGWAAPAPSALLLVLHKASSTHRQEQHPHYQKQTRLLPAQNISQTLLINFSSMQDE